MCVYILPTYEYHIWLKRGGGLNRYRSAKVGLAFNSPFRNAAGLRGNMPFRCWLQNLTMKSNWIQRSSLASLATHVWRRYGKSWKKQQPYCEQMDLCKRLVQNRSELYVYFKKLWNVRENTHVCVQSCLLNECCRIEMNCICICIFDKSADVSGSAC